MDCVSLWIDENNENTVSERVQRKLIRDNSNIMYLNDKIKNKKYPIFITTYYVNIVLLVSSKILGLAKMLLCMCSAPLKTI